MFHNAISNECIKNPQFYSEFTAAVASLAQHLLAYKASSGVARRCFVCRQMLLSVMLPVACQFKNKIKEILYREFQTSSEYIFSKQKGFKERSNSCYKIICENIMRGAVI